MSVRQRILRAGRRPLRRGVFAYELQLSRHGTGTARAARDRQPVCAGRGATCEIQTYEGGKASQDRIGESVLNNGANGMAVRAVSDDSQTDGPVCWIISDLTLHALLGSRFDGLDVWRSVGSRWADRIYRTCGIADNKPGRERFFGPTGHFDAAYTTWDKYARAVEQPAKCKPTKATKPPKIE